MATLNKQRMWQLVRWQWDTQRHIIFKVVAVLASVFFLFFMVRAYASHSGVQSVSSLLYSVLFFSFLLVGTQCFSKLSDKQWRVRLLMLPASNGEKMVSTYVLNLVLCLLQPLVAYVLADVLQWLVALIIDYHAAYLTTPSLLMGMCYGIGELFSLTAFSGLEALLALVWLHSVYLLGGIFFRKYSVLWTTIVLGGLGVLVSIAMAILGLFWLRGLAASDFYWVESYPWAADVVRVVVDVLALLVISFNYWLTFRIFKRLQVINNRFFNW